MSENEVIERLQCMRLFMEIEDKNNESKFLEDDYIANKIAIQALEEIQQYRAIGTVEECKADKVFADKAYKFFRDDIELLKEYRAIGTIEECRTAVEKMKPKKVEIKPWSPARCPACGYTLSESQGDGYYSHPTFLGRCPIEDCGQVLDWSE